MKHNQNPLAFFPAPSLALFLAILLTLSLALSGCSALAEAATPTPEAQAAGDSNTLINATGVVVPRQWAALSLPSQGLVSEVLVAEGDAVTAGQPLLRLEGQAGAQSKVSTAEYELADSQSAIDHLQQDAAVETAQALQDLQDAQRAVMDAERLMVPFDLQQYKDDLERARDAVVDTKDSLDTAEEDFAPYKDWDESNSTRKTYKDRLDEAQRKYDEAVRVENELVLGKDQAASALQTAQAELSRAQAEYDLRKDGPASDTLSLAQARLERATAQLQSAQAELADLELRAPFDGVVVSLDARPGEWLAPGQVAIHLGDLGSLQVETTDLNEIDAARIQPGAPVTLTFDALPDVSVSGTVQRVALKAAQGSGVNYKVVVRLDEIPTNLRWGMTAFVDIEVRK